LFLGGIPFEFHSQRIENLELITAGHFQEDVPNGNRAFEISLKITITVYVTDIDPARKVLTYNYSSFLMRNKQSKRGKCMTMHMQRFWDKGGKLLASLAYNYACFANDCWEHWPSRRQVINGTCLL
jgi:hypothetical protein